MKSALKIALAALVCAGGAYAEPVARAGRAAAQAPAAKAAPVADAPMAAPLAAGGDRLAAAMTPYAAYQRDVGALRGFAPKSGADVEKAVERLAEHNPNALSKGWIAYGAVAASQSPAFAEEIAKVAAGYGRDKAVLWFTTIPNYAGSLKGADEARRLALAAAAADGDRVGAVGESMRSLARSLDKTAWASKALPAAKNETRRKRLNTLAETSAPVLAPEISARLAAMAAGDAAGFDPGAIGTGLVWEAVETGAAVADTTALAPKPAYAAATDQVATVDVMLSLAALKILGAVKDAPPAELEKLLGHPHAAGCFARQTQVYSQCVSASKFYKENVACMAAEALIGRSQCVRNIVSAPATAALASH